MEREEKGAGEFKDRRCAVWNDHASRVSGRVNGLWLRFLLTSNSVRRHVNNKSRVDLKNTIYIRWMCTHEHDTRALVQPILLASLAEGQKPYCFNNPFRLAPYLSLPFSVQRQVVYVSTPWVDTYSYHLRPYSLFASTCRFPSTPTINVTA